MEMYACSVHSPSTHNDNGCEVSWSRFWVERIMVATSRRDRADGEKSGSRRDSMANGVWMERRLCANFVSMVAFHNVTLCCVTRSFASVVVH